MSQGLRLTVAGLALAALAVVVGTTVVPTHVPRGAGSLRCGTVLHPDRTSEIARFCGAAGAQHLRATLVLGAVLAVLALLPVVIGTLGSRSAARALSAAWAVAFLFVTVVGVLSLTVIGYSPPREAFEL